jgi:hypothetical protein
MKCWSRTGNELDMGDGLEETVANIKDLNGRTALHFAAVGGRAHVCRYLTAEAKLDVNARDGKGIGHKLDCYKFQFRKRLYLSFYLHLRYWQKVCFSAF